MIKTNLSILLGVIMLTACSSEEKKEVKDDVVSTESVENIIEEDADLNKELQFKIDLIIGNNITGPSKVITDVKAQEIGRFQENLIVPLKAGAEFEGTSVAKGLSLGAFGVDVTYLSVYDRPDLALKYVASVSKLNEDLDCGMKINKETLEAFEAAKEDGEQMSKLMYDQYFLMEGYLKSNARLETAAHIMVGGIIESLFISTSQLIDVELTAKAIDILYGQKQAINDLIGVYKEMEGNETIIDELTEIQTVFNKPSTDFTKEDLIKLSEVIKNFHDEIASEAIM